MDRQRIARADQILVTIDEKTYKGGTNGDNHPMAWYHDYDGGRAWYTELGHTSESYTEPNFLKHLLGGIKYAMDDNEELDYAKVKTPKIPALKDVTPIIKARLSKPF